MTLPTAAGRLSGKVALITGATGGIGEVLTRCFLAEGATVVMSGRNSARLQTLHERFVQQEGVAEDRVTTLVVDGRDSDAIRLGVAAIVHRFGRIDLLVNNASGDGPRQPLVQLPIGSDALEDESLAGAVASVLGVAWNFMRAVAPHIPPGGAIINVSTIFSRADYYGRTPYVVPKAALNALSQAVAHELGARGVRVNLIYPGPIEGERTWGAFQRMDALKGNRHRRLLRAS